MAYQSPLNGASLNFLAVDRSLPLDARFLTTDDMI